MKWTIASALFVIVCSSGGLNAQVSAMAKVQEPATLLCAGQVVSRGRHELRS